MLLALLSSLTSSLKIFLRLEGIAIPSGTEKLKPIAWPGPLPRANPGDGLGDALNPALRQQLRQQLAETVAGVRSRYGITWNWS